MEQFDNEEEQCFSPAKCGFDKYITPYISPRKRSAKILWLIRTISCENFKLVQY